MKMNRFFVFLMMYCLTPNTNCAEELCTYRLKGKGFVAIIDCRRDSHSIDCQESIDAVMSVVEVDARYFRGEQFSFGSVKRQLATTGANVAVFIVDDSSLPMALTAREEGWALVNASPLKENLTFGKTLQRRLSVLIVRESCRVLGSDEFVSKSTCFGLIRSVEDIDAIKSLDLTMNVTMSITDTMKNLGVEQVEYGTYEDACQMGVAPQPTNAVQRAIWEKVHAPPKTPLKIKFDPATQKGKVTK